MKKTLRTTAGALALLLALSACARKAVPSAPVSASQSETAQSAPASVSSAPESVSPAPEASAPESVSPAPEASARAPNALPAPAPAAWWQTGLSKKALVVTPDFCGGAYTRCYIYDDVKKISDYAGALFAGYADAPYESGGFYEDGDLTLLLDGAKEAADVGARILPENFYEVHAPDDTKYTMEFYEKGVSVTRSLPGEGKGDSVLLELDAANYAEALSRVPGLLAGAQNSDTHFPSWLTMMRRSRCTGVTYTSVDGAASDSHALGEAVSSWMWDDLYPLVTGGGQGSSLTSLPDAAKVEITFNNGLVYDLWFSDTELLLRASDVETAMLYRLRFAGSQKETFDHTARGELNPVTGKPVIYLYPTEPTDCRVTVDYGAFKETIPAYENGWEVTAYPDGRLVNRSDGQAYPYLFWDGDKPIAFDRSKGFCVAQDELEAFLREKLAYLGLLPQESEEFLAYWLPRMQASPYYCIAFAGEDYERAAPLTVTPAPDCVLRVHMAFWGVPAPQKLPAQELAPFSRSGFAVVEWGGSELGRMAQ